MPPVQRSRFASSRDTRAPPGLRHSRSSSPATAPTTTGCALAIASETSAPAPGFRRRSRLGERRSPAAADPGEIPTSAFWESARPVALLSPTPGVKFASRRSNSRDCASQGRSVSRLRPGALADAARGVRRTASRCCVSSKGAAPVSQTPVKQRVLLPPKSGRADQGERVAPTVRVRPRTLRSSCSRSLDCLTTGQSNA